MSERGAGGWRSSCFYGHVCSWCHRRVLTSFRGKTFSRTKSRTKSRTCGWCVRNVSYHTDSRWHSWVPRWWLTFSLVVESLSGIPSGTCKNSMAGHNSCWCRRRVNQRCWTSFLVDHISWTNSRCHRVAHWWVRTGRRGWCDCRINSSHRRCHRRTR